MTDALFKTMTKNIYTKLEEIINYHYHTFACRLIWYMDPSVLTTFAVLGLVLTTVDFAVPLVSPYIFANREW